MLEPPYLSPGRHDSTTKYPHGLGIFSYHHQVHTTLPPSPSPSDSWSNHVSSASPVMAQAIADPYASGAFEHPIIRTPQPWQDTRLSPRSSASPITVAPLYSHNGADNAYHEMNQGIGAVHLEGHGWPHDSRYAHNESALPPLRHHSLTVAPERLTNAMHPYEHVYNTSEMTTLAPTPSAEHNDRYVPGSSGEETSSRAEFPQLSAHPVPRQQVRKRQSSAPVIFCTLCPEPKRSKGFARVYNFKKHMETHDPDRPKPHVCYLAHCQLAFVRKADRDRHHKSRHTNVKDEICPTCPAAFSRRDTRLR